MAQFIADRRDVDFVLHEQLRVETLSEHEKYAEFNKKTIDLIISEARNLAVKELLPIQADGDREGARFEGGNVTVPESFHKAWDLFKEGEWVALSNDPEWGGQGMPVTISLAANDYFIGANFAFMVYPRFDPRCRQTGANIWNRSTKKTVFKKDVHRGMDRYDAVDRTGSRIGCGRIDHCGS